MAAGPGLAVAQDPTSSRVETELRVFGIYTDNFYYDTADSGIKESAGGGAITPRVGFKRTTGAIDLVVLLAGEMAAFDTPGGMDDYEDGRAEAAASFHLSRRSRVDLRGGLQRGHDPFGTNRTEDVTVRDTELDIWHVASSGALFHFGSPAAVLNAELGVSALDREYQTNESLTRVLNYDSASANYTVFYNYSPKTAALVDFVRTDVEFDEGFAGVDTRSGDEYRVRAGLRWLATGKTSGDVRFGFYRREFENTTFSDEGFDWHAGIDWAPRPRTLVSLATSRSTQESYRLDTFANNVQAGSLRWTQHWMAKTTSTVTLAQTRTEFLGSDRVDRLYNGGLAMEHALTRHFSLVLGLDVFNRDSNDPSFEFDRFTSYFGVRLGR